MTERAQPAALLLLLLGAASAGAWAQPVSSFSDATASSGIEFRNVCGAPPGSKGWLTEAMGSGAAWLDFDRDGKLDLYLVNGSTYERKAGKGEPNRLFRGDGTGKFVDVTDSAGVGHRGWGQGVAVGDYDNDGDPDLYVTNYGANVLYRNDGDGSFTDVTGEAGVGDTRWGTSAAFLDMDGDSDLDLYVGNYMECDPAVVPRRAAPNADSGFCFYRGIPVFCGPLGQVAQQDVVYRNDGKGQFGDATPEAGMLLGEPRFTLGVVTGDYDGDGDQDIYVANDSVQNSLWRNDGKGKFEDVGVLSLSALNADGRAQAGMGTDMGDLDGDGWLDLVVTNFSYDLNTLYRNMKGRYFQDVSMLAGLGVTNMALSWGAGFRDFDLDGDVDLFIANGHIYPQVDDHDIGTRFRQTNHLFINQGKGRLAEQSAKAGAGLGVKRSFRGAAFADYDSDGDVDVLVTALDDEVLLLRNDVAPGNHFLEVDLVGKQSNRDGVGARVQVTTKLGSQVRERTGGGSYLSASHGRLHFGLGKAEIVSSLQVDWPSGKRDVLREVAVDRVLVVEEGSTAKE